MNKTELRIGNIVKDWLPGHQYPAVVTELFEQGAVLRPLYGEETHYITPYDAIEGKELTPAYLGRFGFTKVHNDCWQLTNGFWLWEKKESDKYFERGWYWGDYWRITWVHDLQNLYQTLIKQELQWGIE